MLSTLVDRAVCMPYAKPQVLRHGHRRFKDKATGRWRTGATIRQDVAEAAALLVRSFRSPQAYCNGSAARLVIDPAGPWWPKALEDFLSLESSARQWVLDRLESTADRVAECLEDEAVDSNWAWLWSQPSLAAPGKLRPSVTRPDLLAGFDWKRVEVIDLKTTSQKDLHSVVGSDHANRFASWAASLQTMRFIPIRCLALVVSTVDERSEWVQTLVPVNEDDTGLRTQSTRDLLHREAAILSELQRRGVSRTSGSLTGEIGEHLAQSVYGGMLAPPTTAGHDLTDDRGRRIQVKVRSLPRAVERIFQFSDLAFDLAVCLRFDRMTNELVWARELSRDEIAELSSPHETGPRLSTRTAATSGRDVTAEFRAAYGEADRIAGASQSPYADQQCP